MGHIGHVAGRLHRRAVDRDEHVATLDPGGGACQFAIHVDRRHALGTRRPEHAVLDLVPPGAERDVGDAEREQNRDNDHGERGSRPNEPGAVANRPRVLRFRHVSYEIQRLQRTDRRVARDRGTGRCWNRRQIYFLSN